MPQGAAEGGRQPSFSAAESRPADSGKPAAEHDGQRIRVSQSEGAYRGSQPFLVNVVNEQHASCRFRQGMLIKEIVCVLISPQRALQHAALPMSGTEQNKEAKPAACRRHCFFSAHYPQGMASQLLGLLESVLMICTSNRSACIQPSLPLERPVTQDKMPDRLLSPFLASWESR